MKRNARETEPSSDRQPAKKPKLEKKPRKNIRKLAPARPFPTVATSNSATGPRSAHKEGKNYICLTRKTPLAAYLRRCSDLITKDGYTSLHLSAMGAAIPHLTQLTVSLPTILGCEMQTEVLTGTTEVRDEVIPDDEAEDISYQTRSKSTLMIVLRTGEKQGKKKVTEKPTQVVTELPEQV